jgi:cell division protein FtsX
MATIDNLTTTAEERKVLLAELNAKIAAWDRDDVALSAMSDKLATDIEAGRRRHQADKLVSELYGSSYGNDTLRTAIEEVLAQTTAPLDDAACIALRRHHEAQQLVRKIVELKGPLSVDAETKLVTRLERAMATAVAAAPWESNNNVRNKKK